MHLIHKVSKQRKSISISSKRNSMTSDYTACDTAGTFKTRDIIFINFLDKCGKAWPIPNI